jgi:hypothetical protein
MSAGIEETITQAGHTHRVAVSTSDREMVAQAIMHAILDALPADLTAEGRFSGGFHLRPPADGASRRAIVHIEYTAVRRHSCMVKAE